MSKLDLDAIEARCNAATPGPWAACPYGIYIFAADGSMIADDGHNEDDPAFEGKNMVCQIRGAGAINSGHRKRRSQADNIDFIAHARTDVPALIACIRELELESE